MKKELVRSIGFGGMLLFPPIRQVNRRFAVWLMCRVDPLSQTLVLDDGKKIKFSKEDVALVFGLTCNGRSVSDCGIPRKDSVKKILSGYLGIRQKEKRSIKAALEVIQRDYSGRMSAAEESAFKAAFVIYVMSTLLSPGAKYDYASADYWNALVVSSEIHLYDWSQYVIHRLFDAVVKVKSDMRKYGKVSSITGCCLFLQVLYLDSIDLGVLNLPHNKFPRVSIFNQDLMKSMIMADTLSELDDCSDSYGKSKLRASQDVCYQWAQELHNGSFQGASSGHIPPWKAAAAVACQLNLPFEVAAVMHFVVDVSEEEKCKSGFYSFFDGISMMCAVVQPFVRGFRYTTLTQCKPAVIRKMAILSGVGIYPGSSCECQSSSDSSATSSMTQDLDIFTSCCQQCSSRRKKYRVCNSSSTCDVPLSQFQRLLFNMSNSDMDDDSSGSSFISVDPVYALQLRCLALKAMARYYLAVSYSKAGFGQDFGETSSDLFELMEVSHRYFPVCKTPWELGLRRSYVDLELDLFGMHSMSSNHSCRLKLSNVVQDAMELQFNGQSEIEVNLFEVVLRLFKDMDMQLYSGVESNRWRHFTSSYFVESILASTFSLDDNSLKLAHGWCNPGYDVTQCKMLFFPALMEHRWVCYAWDIGRNSIAVYDPLISADASSGQVELHSLVVKSLKFAMQQLVSKLRLKWTNHWLAASFWLVKPFSDMCFSDRCLINRSGALCLQFCFSFDGFEDSVRDRLVYSDRALRMMHGDVLDFLSRA